MLFLEYLTTGRLHGIVIYVQVHDFLKLEMV